MVEMEYRFRGAYAIILREKEWFELIRSTKFPIMRHDVKEEK